MTDTETTTDDGSTAGKTTRTIRALVQAHSDPSEGGAPTVIDLKSGGKED